MSLSGLIKMLYSSDNAQEQSSDKEFCNSSDDFLANELRTSNTMTQHEKLHVHGVPKEVFGQGHMFN